jgi:hypothetical protein
MIPLSTTTITVLAVDSSAGPGEPVTTTPIAAGVRAHISAPDGSELREGAQFETATATLTCDPTPMDNSNQVLDELTGDIWQVTFTMQRPNLGGLGHRTANLVKVTVAA